MAVADVAQSGPVAVRRLQAASGVLHGLGDDHRDRFGALAIDHCRHLVEKQRRELGSGLRPSEFIRVRDVECFDGGRAKRLFEAGHAGERQRAERDAVIRAVARDRLRAVRLAVRDVVLADQLPRGLDRLRAAVRKEHVVERAGRNPRQSAGQLHRRRVGHTPVGRERQLDQLPTRDLSHLGAERVPELCAEQIRQAVEVAPAQTVDYEHALAPLENEQLDVSVPGPTVAREVEQQMIGGGNRRAHVWRR